MALSKIELKKIKLEKEIEVLEADITDRKKPWYQKNLAIMIPSLLGLATLLTGFFTGFFDAEKLNLENQKHDLESKVANFTYKKDSLHKVNDLLIARNVVILKQNNVLNKHYLQLKDSTGKLSANIVNLKKKSLELQLEVETAAFDLPWKKFLVGDSIEMSETFPQIIDVIENATTYREIYLSQLSRYQDTTRNLVKKEVIQSALYNFTGDLPLKERILKEGIDIIGRINRNKEKNNHRNTIIWQVIAALANDRDYFTIQNGKRAHKIIRTPVADRKQVLVYLLKNIEKIDPVDIYGAYLIASINEVVKQAGFEKGDAGSLIKYVQRSHDFNRLLKICIDGLINKNTNAVPQSYLSFLQYFAPIASVCGISQLVTTDKYFRADNRDEGSNDLTMQMETARSVIEQNTSVLSSPKPYDTKGGWIKWEKENEEILTLFRDFSENYNEGAVKKLIGTNIDIREIN